MYDSFDDLFDEARRRPIEDIFAPLNLKRVGRFELKGPCPKCGGHDRLVVDTKKQVFFCRHCAATKDEGAGNVIAAVMFLYGFDSVAAAEHLAGGSNRIPIRIPELRDFAPPPSSPPAAGSTGWRDLWESARDLYGSVGLSYLTGPKAQGGRALVLPAGIDGTVLRFLPHCPTPKSGKADGRFVPAVLALYRNIMTDEPQAVMRIGLTNDGRKIDRWDLGPKTSAAIKLMPAVDGKLCLAEGVETALAARMLGHTPVWAAGGRAGMAQFPLIDGINELGILLDHDVNLASQKSGAEAFERWSAAGRDAWFDMPENPGEDFNDLVG